MNRKRFWQLLFSVFVLAFLIYLFVPRDYSPPPSTRIILEHSVRTYIAPSCFEQSGASNFIEEADLDRAYELGYRPHSECTESALDSREDQPFFRFLKDAGLLEKETRDW